MDFFQGTQERVQNSHGKRAISVRGLLYVLLVTRVEFTKADNYYKLLVLQTDQKTLSHNRPDFLSK